MSASTISPSELANRLGQSSSLLLIDVRTPAEFREAHVTGAQNVPLERVSPTTIPTSGDTIHVICQKGGRGEQACRKLTDAGLTNVVNVEGGTTACIAAGLPITRGKKTMSLERQVRIAAGALVVTGAALGFFVHPYWIGLAGFVGAGLVFAGITDTCGMGMLIARMPWNQVGGGAAPTCQTR